MRLIKLPISYERTESSGFSSTNGVDAGPEDGNNDDPYQLSERFFDTRDSMRGINFSEAQKDEELLKALEMDSDAIKFLFLSPDKRTAMMAAELRPGAAIALFDDYKNSPYAKDILQLAAKKEPAVAVEHYKRYKDSPFAEEILKQAAKDEPAHALIFPKFYEQSPNAKEIFRQAAWDTSKNKPTFVLRDFDPESIFDSKGSINKILGEKEGNDLLEEAAFSAAIKDPFSAERYKSTYEDKPYASKVNNMSELLISTWEDMNEKQSIGERQDYLKTTISNINKNFLSGLDEFNKETGLFLQPMGINNGDRSHSSNRPYEFIFINTFSGSDSRPVVLGMDTLELTGAKTKGDVTKLLKEKHAQEQKNNSEQYSIWNNEYNYDLPRDGKTAVMMTLVPGNTKGQETDFARLATIYTNHFGASIEAINMQNKDVWQNLKGVKEKTETGELPKAKGASKQEILTTLKTSIQKAIDDKKSTFLFHYMMHGQEDGTMAPASDKNTPPSDSLISSSEIADLLASTSENNGKPLSEQIDINIIADSCFSGRQLERIVTNLQQKQVPVKDLTIIATSSKDKPSTTSMTPSIASLISDKMKEDKDWSGAFSYYLSYYFELLEHEKAQGIEPKGSVGSFSHAIQFADLMVTRDSYHGAKPQAIHYSNDPDKKKVINQFFSQSNEIIGEDSDLPSDGKEEVKVG